MVALPRILWVSSLSLKNGVPLALAGSPTNRRRLHFREPGTAPDWSIRHRLESNVVFSANGGVDLRPVDRKRSAASHWGTKGAGNRPGPLGGPLGPPLRAHSPETTETSQPSAELPQSPRKLIHCRSGSQLQIEHGHHGIDAPRYRWKAPMITSVSATATGSGSPTSSTACPCRSGPPAAARESRRGCLRSKT